MNEQMRSVLGKIKKFELKTMLSYWGRLPADEVNYQATKYEVIEQVINLMVEYCLNLSDVEQLDLLYLMHHPNKKLWKAYQMEDSTGSLIDPLLDESNAFQSHLLDKLYLSHSCSVQVHKYKYAFWGRVKRPSSVQVLYFIYFPFSPYLLISKASSQLTLIVTEALKHLLGYKRVKEKELESFSPDALAQILLHNVDKNTEYTYDKGYFKPDERQDTEDVRSFCDERVTIQHMDKLLTSKTYIDKMYGNTEQPMLPSLTVTSNTQFRGRMHIPNVREKTLIRCRTRIVGSTVLEGLRKASLLGLCRVPMPRYLTNVRNTGQQCIKLTDKKPDD